MTLLQNERERIREEELARSEVRKEEAKTGASARPVSDGLGIAMLTALGFSAHTCIISTRTLSTRDRPLDVCQQVTRVGAQGRAPTCLTTAVRGYPNCLLLTARYLLFR